MLTPEQIQAYRSQYNITPVSVETPAMKMKTDKEKESSASGLFGPAKEALGGLKTLYGGGEQSIASKLKQNVQAGAQDIQEGNVVKGVAKAGLRTAGDVAGAVYAPVGAALEATGANKLFNKIGEKFAGSSIGQKITDIPAAQEFAMKHPNAAEDFNRAMMLILSSRDKGQIQPKTVGSRTMSQIKGIPGGAGDAFSKIVKHISPLARGTGRILKAAGEEAYRTTITPQETTAQAMRHYDAKQPGIVGRVKNLLTGEGTEGKPTTEANTAARHGLMGTEYRLGVQSEQVAKSLWQNEIGPKLDKTKGQIDIQSFFRKIEKRIAGEKTELGRRTDLMEALEAFKEPYKKVKGVGLKKLQGYKEGWAESVPEASYKGKPIGSALKDVKSIASEEARKVIYKFGGPGIRQAYIDYGNLQSIMKAGDKSLMGDPAAKSVTRNVWEFVMNKAVTPVMTTAGKVLYKTGEGLEFMGDPGAKTVGDVVGAKPLIITQQGKAENKVKITKPTKLKVRQEGKAENKIKLYGGQTPPKPEGGLPSIEY